MKNTFLHLARFGDMFRYLLITVIMCPVALISYLYRTLCHAWDMLRGCGSHDWQEHLMFWTWEEWEQ